MNRLPDGDALSRAPERRENNKHLPVMDFIATIGLEVHVQLATRTKMFCGCGTAFGAPPNTQVCPVCLGYPGALPVMNEEALRLTVLTGLMLGSTIPCRSVFDRKNYFYPDMPKNYQISQYESPLCVGGSLEIDCDGALRTVHLTRIHLEEDVGKSMHVGEMSSLDFNRAGHPLMEIVTDPDMESPRQAHVFLQALKQILVYGGVSECNLEEGNMRCDVNCSVRPAGENRLGVKAEIKNLNTFKGVFQALDHEIERQKEVLRAGGCVTSETRRWDADAGATFAMRSKEAEHDYRYFTDPDLMPVVLSKNQIASWRNQLPELPRQRRERIEREYGIPAYDAGVLAADKNIADYFEAAAKGSSNPKSVSNWMMTEMLRLLSEREMSIKDVPMKPNALTALVELTECRKINSNSAKDIFAFMFESGGDPVRLVEEQGLAQVSDAGELDELVSLAMTENPKSVEDYRAGKKAASKFLVGQVMRKSRGKANPQVVGELLEKKLAEISTPGI